MKTNWTIWQIKNRWLRTAVAWPIAIVGVVVLAVVTVGFIIISAAVGVRDGIADATNAKERDEWAEVWRAIWAALTAKEHVS